VGWLLLRAAADRSAQQAAFVEELLGRSPALAALCSAVRHFFSMLRQHRAGDLAAWPQEADTSGIPELVAVAQGVRRDLSAIQAAFTSSWSQGQTEGHITRLKLLKRQM
jgi:transposase